MQILNYKFSLQREFLNLSTGSGRRFEAFDPRCVVILGSTAQVKTEPDKLRALNVPKFLFCSDSDYIRRIICENSPLDHSFRNSELGRRRLLLSAKKREKCRPSAFQNGGAGGCGSDQGKSLIFRVS